MKHIVCRSEDMAPGSRVGVDIGSRSFVVIKTANGEYSAMRNACPHQGARLSDGELTGTNLPSCVGEYVYGREKEILRCPWHRWEFDVKDGKAVFPDGRTRVKTYEVTVEEGNVILHY